MTREYEEVELKPYAAHELRSDILDMVEWAAEDGMAWWEIYGVISGIEKFVELTMRADLLIRASGDEE